MIQSELVKYLKGLIIDIEHELYYPQRTKKIDVSNKNFNDFETRKVILIIDGKTNTFGT